MIITNRYVENVISELNYAAQKMKNLTGKRDVEGFLTPEQNGAFFDFVAVKKRFLDRSKMLVKRGKIELKDIDYVLEYDLKLTKDLNENFNWRMKVYEQDTNGHCKEVIL